MEDAREIFGDNGSFTWIQGGDIGRIIFAIDVAGDIERLKTIGDVDEESAVDESGFVCR